MSTGQAFLSGKKINKVQPFNTLQKSKHFFKRKKSNIISYHHCLGQNFDYLKLRVLFYMLPSFIIS